MAETDKTEQELETGKNYEIRTEQHFKPYLPKLYALADQVNEIEADISDLCKCIEAQSVAFDCRQAATSVEKRNSTKTCDTHGVVMRISSAHGASQRFVPAVLRPWIFCFCHYSLLAGHPGERRKHITMRRDFCCLYMANSVYETVRDYHFCAQNRQTDNKQRKPRLFPPS